MKAVVFILISNDKLTIPVKAFLVSLLTVIVDGEVRTENDMISMDYEITSGSVDCITIDTNATSLIVDITASEDGSLNVTLPRKIIDSRYEEQDDIFYLLIDGEEIEFEETEEDDKRTLTIPITKESRQIEIIGTEAISELVTIGEDLALATMIST